MCRLNGKVCIIRELARPVTPAALLSHDSTHSQRTWAWVRSDNDDLRLFLISIKKFNLTLNRSRLHYNAKRMRIFLNRFSLWVLLALP